ncbi:GntR family transcriptional regulator [Streptomyces fuscigenes]|nr:GntR family transcriptional regulator [Streptomyces fuscigenes]MCF3963185.1 GntR family transcriptional regulator [Streptomyces fuscigenes]
MPTTDDGHRDGRSLHERIAADLRDRIMTGDLAPGVKLPSTARLKEQFAASNATIQKALQLLKDERLVVGRAGSAVTVREHRQQTVRPAASTAPRSDGEPYPWLPEGHAGRAWRSRLLTVGEVVPPADVAAALRLAAGDTAIHRSQVLTVDGEPVELVHTYYPPEVARGTALAQRQRVKGGSPALLAELGLRIVRCVDLVTARVPTQEQYEALRLPGDLPVLRTLRVAYAASAAGERPVEATVMTKAGHLYELRYEFHPDLASPAGGPAPSD